MNNGIITQSQKHFEFDATEKLENKATEILCNAQNRKQKQKRQKVLKITEKNHCISCAGEEI